MVTSCVVWCLKNDRWVPLQLSSIRLHGVLTQAHWAAVSKFLQQVANKQLVLQENGFTEPTEQQKEVLLLQHVKTGLDSNNKTCSESGAELKKTDDKLIENEDDDGKSKIETPCINVEEVKQQQWQNVVIEENGILQILNNRGKTEIDSSHIESQSNVNSLIKIPEQSIVSDDSRIFTLNFEQPVNKSLEQISSTDSKDCDNHQFQEIFPSNDINNSNNVDRNNCNLFIDNLLQETDNSKNVSIIGRFTIEQNEDSTNDPNSNNINNNNVNKTDRKNSTQSDEIVLRLLRKYSKYSRGALDDEILNAIDSFSVKEPDNNNSPCEVMTRSRKMSVIHKEEKLYENCNDFFRSSFHEENFENERNEHLLRWLKQQSKQKNFWDTRENNRKLSLPCPDSKTNSWGADTKKCVTTESSPTDRRKSCITFKSHSRKSSVSSAFESRKSSLNSSPDSRKSSISSPSISDSGKFSDFESRKNSVTSNSSCSESEESGTITTHWQKNLEETYRIEEFRKEIKEAT